VEATSKLGFLKLEAQQLEGKHINAGIEFPSQDSIGEEAIFFFSDQPCHE
jgi:hypothetical protein